MDTKTNLHRFDPQIDAIEKHWQERPPLKGGILLYGSSTMANWRKDDMCYKHLAPYPVANAGFGGATAEEALYYYHRLVRPCCPSVMVYYEGANDISNGYSPEEIIETTHRLFEWSRLDFPGIKFAIVPIKMSPGLKISKTAGEKCNSLFTSYAERHADTCIIDVSKLLYNDKGDLRTDVYIEDMFHHNPKGYEELGNIVKVVLAKLYPLRTE